MWKMLIVKRFSQFILAPQACCAGAETINCFTITVIIHSVINRIYRAKVNPTGKTLVMIQQRITKHNSGFDNQTIKPVSHHEVQVQSEVVLF